MPKKKKVEEPYGATALGAGSGVAADKPYEPLRVDVQPVYVKATTVWSDGRVEHEERSYPNTAKRS